MDDGSEVAGAANWTIRPLLLPLTSDDVSPKDPAAATNGFRYPLRPPYIRPLRCTTYGPNGTLLAPAGVPYLAFLHKHRILLVHAHVLKGVPPTGKRMPCTPRLTQAQRPRTRQAKAPPR